MTARRTTTARRFSSRWRCPSASASSRCSRSWCSRRPQPRTRRATTAPAQHRPALRRRPPHGARPATTGACKSSNARRASVKRSASAGSVPPPTRTATGTMRGSGWRTGAASHRGPRSPPTATATATVTATATASVIANVTVAATVTGTATGPATQTWTGAGSPAAAAPVTAPASPRRDATTAAMTAATTGGAAAARRARLGLGRPGVRAGGRGRGRPRGLPAIARRQRPCHVPLACGLRRPARQLHTPCPNCGRSPRAAPPASPLAGAATMEPRHTSACQVPRSSQRRHRQQR